jgi:hypothetical protein
MEMSYCLQFVTAEAVGWIPYYENLRDIPRNAYYTFASEGKRKWLACDMLFYSGNTPTPEAEFFQQQREFTELLRSKNFRGALSLRDIRLYCYDDDTYLIKHRSLKDESLNNKSLKNEDYVGYTPLRLPGFRSKKVWRFTKGVGSTIEPSAEYTDTGARFSYEVRFRVSRILNVGARFLTKSWAPDVWLRVDYELNRDGKCKIGFSGSQIPSSVHYTTGQSGPRQRVYYHDMENNELMVVKNLICPPQAGRAVEMYEHFAVADGWIVDA